MESNYYSYHVTREGRVFNKFGAELKPQKNGRGYLIVGISIKPYTRITKAIHRLVAEVYLPNPYRLSDVDHTDGDRTNNSVSNLRWLTHGQNIKHSFDSGRRTAKGEDNARAKLTEDLVHDICTLLERGYGPRAIQSMGFGPEGRIGAIKSRRNWTYISKEYSF